MAGTSISEDACEALALEKIYTEVRAGIRETDSISFKLLGLVPLVSGTAMISLVLRSEHVPNNFVILLALFASIVTLGLFRWELRNVQTCSWLINFAGKMELHALKARGMDEILFRRPKPPQGIGKTEAEKLIYTATVLAWLALPFAMNAAPQRWYYIAAGVVFIGTIASLSVTPRVSPLGDSQSIKPLQPTSTPGL